MFINSEDMFSCEFCSSSNEKRKDSDGLAYRLIDEITSLVFELDIYLCVHFICPFLNDYTRVHYVHLYDL